VTTAPVHQIWERYVAIGDSFSEGMCDPLAAPGTAYVGSGGPLPDGVQRYAGWTDRLAVALDAAAQAQGSRTRYANLAVRGRLLADIVGPQVQAAIALEPDLVSIVGGGNDILRSAADIDALADQLETAVATLRETGADVLMATPMDPREAPVMKYTRGRAAAYAANIWTIANRHGAHVIDQWTMAALRDWRLWAPDRIHLNAEGHRRIALHALHALGHHTDQADWRTPLPDKRLPTGRDAIVGDAQWVRDHVTPWLRRRMRGESSGDRLSPKQPQLELPQRTWA
jgi:lysophospholipase L1-like esterase